MTMMKAMAIATLALRLILTSMVSFTQAPVPFSPLLKRQMTANDPLERMQFKFEEFDQTLSKLSVETSMKQVFFCAPTENS